jgi:hypothetical protein
MCMILNSFTSRLKFLNLVKNIPTLRIFNIIQLATYYQMFRYWKIFNFVKLNIYELLQ